MSNVIDFPNRYEAPIRPVESSPKDELRLLARFMVVKCGEIRFLIHAQKRGRSKIPLVLSLEALAVEIEDEASRMKD